MFKNYVINKLHEDNFILKEINDIVNLSNHATILYHIKRYTKPPGYDGFIATYFKECVTNNEYPVVRRNTKTSQRELQFIML